MTIHGFTRCRFYLRAALFSCWNLVRLKHAWDRTQRGSRIYTRLTRLYVCVLAFSIRRSRFCTRAPYHACYLPPGPSYALLPHTRRALRAHVAVYAQSNSPRTRLRTRPAHARFTAGSRADDALHLWYLFALHRTHAVALLPPFARAPRCIPARLTYLDATSRRLPHYARLRTHRCYAYTACTRRGITLRQTRLPCCALLRAPPVYVINASPNWLYAWLQT